MLRGGERKREREGKKNRQCVCVEERKKARGGFKLKKQSIITKNRIIQKKVLEENSISQLIHKRSNTFYS